MGWSPKLLRTSKKSGKPSAAAHVEELVDSSVSEADVRKDVAVQVGSWALNLSSLLLKKHLASICVATGLAVFLGLIAAAIGVLLGPTVKILMAAPGIVIPFDQLFPGIYLELVTTVTGKQGMTSAELLALIPPSLILLAAARAACAGTQWYLWERTGELVARDLRQLLISQYLATAPEALGTKKVQKVSEQISSLVSTNIKIYRDYLVHYYGGLPRELFQVLFLLISLALLSPKLLALFLFAVAPALVLANYIAKRIKKRAGKALADNSTLVEWIQQRLLGIETIKQFRTEGIEKQKFAELTEDLFQKFVKAATTKARSSPSIEAVATTALVLVLTYSLHRIADGESSGAIFMSFFATLALLSQAAGKLGRYVNSNREGAAAKEAITEAMQLLTQFQKDSIAPKAKIELSAANRIVCHDVTVKYPGSNKPALEEFDYQFEAGKFYVICGSSGAGKSTLFRSILNLQPTSSGSIRFFQSETHRLPLVYVPQQLILLPGTLAQNVAYPETDLDRSRVEKCLTKVDLKELIGELPQGIDTLVGDTGRQLSGGQNQRVMLARALYHDSPFILLDEPTSALDPGLEKTTLELLRHETTVNNRSVIMIAHRPMALEYADEVVLLESGKKSLAGLLTEFKSDPRLRQAFHL